MIHENNQVETAVNPDPAFGEFDFMLLNMLIKTKNSVMSKDILAGTLAGSITKLLYNCIFILIIVSNK